MRGTLHPTHKMVVTSRIDRVALIVGIIQPLTTLPQIYLTYTSHSAVGISLVMWISYDIGSAVFLIYGIQHRLWPLIFTQIFWLLVQTPMILLFFVLPH